MPADPAAAGRVRAPIAARWRAIDPLLPEPAALPPGCGTELILAGADGPPAAVASCVHWSVPPESLDATWGAARRFQLAARVAGPDVAGALDELLSRWHDHLAAVPGAGEQDTAAVVTWPSRDVSGVQALLRHGFVPLSVVAARTADRAGPAPAPGSAPGLRPAPGDLAGTAADLAGTAADLAGTAADLAGTAAEAAPGLRIRRAGPADIDVVVALGLETVRFDALFGGVVERPQTAQALRREAAGALAEAQPWVWLAERDGTAAGMAWAEPPAAAGWIAALTSRAPVAYILLTGVAADRRGQGAGAALAARAHHEIAAAGVAVTLLHYAVPNPLSVPFWSAQGYRPLWTVWEARPAGTVR
jgi:ribosomal protein S18 acetylase RimI-like enzyme